MSGGHRYVKPIKRTTAPQYLMVCVPEYDANLDLHNSEECRYAARAVWATMARRYGTRWVGVDEPVRFHPDDWWHYVSERCRSKLRLFLVSPNAADFCTATAFWLQIERCLFRLCDGVDGGNGNGAMGKDHGRRWVGRFVMGGPPDIIQSRCYKGSITHVSLRNYTEASYHRLCSAVAYQPRSERPQLAGEADCDYDAYDRCVIATRYMRSLISRWVGRDCGPWKDTAAQLSVTWWRRSFYNAKVCRHDDDKAADLEKASSHGGRAETWFYGDVGDRDNIPDGCDPAPAVSEYQVIPETVYRCDVSSQYPALLATEAFPTRLVGTTGPISVADLTALLKYYEVIAHVELLAACPEYPVRRARETVYPIGRCNTTLAGPELRTALLHGEVAGVRSAAYYDSGYPLRDYATHLLRERDYARTRGDYCSELFAKCLANAIGGKFSQRSTRREPDANVVNPFSRWGPYRRIASDGTETSYVTIAGVCFREVPAESGGKLLGAVYSYLTSYGRVQMRQVREGIYPCIPYSQDTDGIWVGETGYETLRRQGLSADRTPGTLRLESSHGFARWITPRHYYVDGRWTLSGYRHGCTVDTDLSVVEYSDINPVRQCPFKAPAKLYRKVTRRGMATLRNGRLIGPDGWLIPQPLKGEQ